MCSAGFISVAAALMALIVACAPVVALIGLHGGLHPLSPLRPVLGELVNSLSLNSCSEKTTSHFSLILLTWPLFCLQYLSLCMRQYLAVGGNDEIHFYVVKFFSIMPLVIPSGLWTT